MANEDNTMIQGFVGPMKKTDGSVAQARMGLTGEMVTGNAHGFYSEIASRGGVSIVSTAVAGVAPGTALSTTPPMAVWNPPNSGVVLNILRVSLGYVSGTLGAGSIVYAQNGGQVLAPTTGAALTVVNTKLGLNGGQGKAFQGSTVAATPTILRPAFVMGAFLASTATPPAPVFDIVDGSISVPPGNCFVVQGVTAAGSTPLVIIGVEWEETPIPTTPA